MLTTHCVLETFLSYFFFQAEDGIRDHCVTGVQTCALPISTLARMPTLAHMSAMVSISALSFTIVPRPECSVTFTPPACPASDRKSTRLNSSHTVISYAVFCLKKKKKKKNKK